MKFTKEEICRRIGYKNDENYILILHIEGGGWNREAYSSSERNEYIV